jgi:adenylyltransferase/sulfurtransferase
VNQSGVGVKIPEISAVGLKQRLDKGDPLVILDVREPHELEICRICQADRQINIPLSDLPNRVGELAPHKQEDIVVYCRSGGRSASAAGFLLSQGFKVVINLKGGILSWADDVDNSLTKY